MKPQQFFTLAVVLLAMALLLIMTGRPEPSSKELPASETPRTITVMGEGEIKVKADQVILTFGVSTWTQGASAAEAEALSLASVGRLTDTLKAAGADAGTVAVLHPSVTPVTRQDYAGKTYLTGMNAESRVVVTLNNLQRLDALLAAGLGNGATGLEPLTYGLQNPEESRRKALQAAIENARERAAAIASGQGGTLGPLLGVEVTAEEAPVASSTATGGPLLYKVWVRATYSY